MDGTGSDPPPAGARGWIITDDKIGMLVQCRGVADALRLAYVHKQVSPRGLARLLAPWMGPARSERIGASGSAFAAPWPDLAIATGRLSIPYLRALRRLAGPATFTVVLQDPRTGLNTADLIWVPEHDRLRGDNVVTTLTAPHSFSQERLAHLRRTLPPAIAALRSPRAAVVLGGPSASYSFAAADHRRLAAALCSLAALDVTLLITPSRRTPPALIAEVDRATRPYPRILWDGKGENPYPHFLAHADLLVVTADSVNMTGEACATGRPVYVFMPAGGSRKFRRFHASLERYGAARPLPDRVTELPRWSYVPLDAAAEIATWIAERWGRRSP
jgi:mitochondrial fission protein ELM1